MPGTVEAGRQRRAGIRVGKHPISATRLLQIDIGPRVLAQPHELGLRDSLAPERPDDDAEVSCLEAGKFVARRDAHAAVSLNPALDLVPALPAVERNGPADRLRDAHR